MDVIKNWLSLYSSEFVERKSRWDDVYVCIKSHRANELYQKFYKMRDGEHYPKKINDGMIKLGFKQTVSKLNGRCERMWEIPKIYYNKLMSELIVEIESL